MKKNRTARALLMSTLSLLLCVSMLGGSTFAWFTDSVVSANNIIKSGNLDVVLEYWDGDSYEEVTSTTKLFDDAALWEPGYTEVAYLKVSNAGSLALKYQLAVNVYNETLGKTKDNADIKLSDHLQFKVVESDTDLAGTYGSREAAQAAPATATKLQTYNSEAKPLDAKNEAGDNNYYDYVALIIYMPTTVGNEANHNGVNVPKIEMGVNLFATQQTAESDSFDDQYDKGAWHPDFTVTSVEDLAAALAIGGKIQVNGTLNAGATQDVPNWTNAPAEFIFDATTLDALKGGKYVLEQGSRYGFVGLISAGESLALSDMKITANSQWPVYLSNYGGTLTLEDIDVTATQGAGIYPYGTNGTTTIKSATVNQKALSDEFASSTPWAGTAIATSNGHNLIIEDGTYVGSTWGVYVYNSGANVTINGGTFKAPKVIQADGVWSTGGNKSVVTVNDGNFDGALYLDWGTTPPEIYINGGNFTNFSATVNGAAKLVIKGGTFDADPSAYVADGYDVLKKEQANGDEYYTVLKGDVRYPSVAASANGEYRFEGEGANRLDDCYFVVPAGDYTDKAFFSQEFAGGNVFDGENATFADVQVLGNYCTDADDVFTVKNVSSNGKLTVGVSGGTIVIDNCNVKAMRISGASKIIVKNSTINGYGENRNGDNGGYGMYIIPAGNYELSVLNNTINNCDMHCIAVQANGAGAVEVKGNDFKAWGSATNKTERAAFKIWGDTVLAPTNMSSYNDLGNEAKALVADILANNTFPADLTAIGGTGTQVIFDFYDAAFSAAE